MTPYVNIVAGCAGAGRGKGDRRRSSIVPPTDYAAHLTLKGNGGKAEGSKGNGGKAEGSKGNGGKAEVAREMAARLRVARGLAARLRGLC